MVALDLCSPAAQGQAGVANCRFRFNLRGRELIRIEWIKSNSLDLGGLNGAEQGHEQRVIEVEGEVGRRAETKKAEKARTPNAFSSPNSGLRSSP